MPDTNITLAGYANWMAAHPGQQMSYTDWVTYMGGNMSSGVITTPTTPSPLSIASGTSTTPTTSNNADTSDPMYNIWKMLYDKGITTMDFQAYKAYVAGGGSGSGSTSNVTTYPLPAGFQETYIDANGNLQRWNPYTGTYDDAGYTAPATSTASNNLTSKGILYNYVDAQGLTHTVYDDGSDVISGGNASGIDPYQQAMLDYQQQQATAQQAYQQQQLGFQQQQLQYQQQQDAASLAAEKERYLAQLKANPGSWLEYAAASGSTPVVQPWMLPLMPGQYGMGQGTTTQVGTPIQGWAGSNNSAQGMPDLLTPSSQYLARMSPSSRSQYYGYQQADKGATPEDTSWRLWSQAPPSGGNSGLVYSR
jgi:hypothetical protein